jgi:hypothetical protein
MQLYHREQTAKGKSIRYAQSMYLVEGLWLRPLATVDFLEVSAGWAGWAGRAE